jgi:hypothetical protein
MGALPHNRAPEVGSLEKVLERVIKRINNGSSPGVSGWSGSHLAAIWSSGSKAAKDGLHLLLRDLCNGVFSGECRKRLLACRLVPLAKKDRGVRPIAIAEVFTKGPGGGRHSEAVPAHPVRAVSWCLQRSNTLLERSAARYRALREARLDAHNVVAARYRARANAVAA